MPVSLRNIFIFLLLLLAGCLSVWSAILSKQSTSEPIKAATNKPDGFMEEIKATIMNKEGKPTLKVEAPLLTHFPDNDRTELKKPHVIIYRQSPEPWHIHSNYAKTKKGTSEITFWDDVVIHHLADVANPVTTVKTSTLTVFPDQQLAKTVEPIIMMQPATTIQAVGMLANWDKGTVELLSKTREEYIPEHQR